MGRPVVYVDVALALNLAVDLAWLWCAGLLAGTPLRWWRLTAAALLGAVAATAAFWPAGHWLTRWPARVAGTGCLALLAYGFVGWRQLLRRCVWLWMVGAAMAGGALALSPASPWQPPRASGAVFLMLGIATVAGGGALLWRELARRRAVTGLQAEVEVMTAAGRALVSAIVDSGNLLTDPLSGAAVLVVEAEALAACLSPTLVAAAASGQAEEAMGAGAVRLLPYAAVGGGGLLPAVRARVRWRLAAGETGERPTALVALAPGQLRPGGAVRALLPATWPAGGAARGEGVSR